MSPVGLTALLLCIISAHVISTSPVDKGNLLRRVLQGLLGKKIIFEEFLVLNLNREYAHLIRLHITNFMF